MKLELEWDPQVQTKARKRLRIGKNFQVFFMLKIGIKKMYIYICTSEGVLGAFLCT